MSERQVERSAGVQVDDEQTDGGVWRSIVERLVKEGEPLANALRIADRIVRRGHQTDASRADPNDADSRPSEG